MKGKYFAGILLLGCAIVLDAARCGSSPPPAIPEDSLYQLESVWETQDGAQIHLRDLAGKALMVGLIFTRCPGICPALVADMQRIEKNVSLLHRRHIAFVLLSIDPGRDDPPAMRAYMQKMNLRPGRWTFLRGSASDLTDLASLLGVKIAPMPDGTLSHTRMITVLSPDGRILYQDSRVTEDASNFLTPALAGISIFR